MNKGRRGRGIRIVVQKYQQAADSQDQYVQAAEQAFDRLSPQQRQKFGQTLRQQAQAQGVGLPTQGSNPQQLQQSGFLAQMAGQVHQQQPTLLTQLSGGGGGGNTLAKAALGGVAAMAVKNMMSGSAGRGGSLL